MRKYSRICGIWIVVIVTDAGCTTLKAVDAYMDSNHSVSETVEFKGGSLRYQIDPITKFAASGVAGVPIVPTTANLNTRVEVALHLWVELAGPHKFQFMRKPCLLADHRYALCADKLLVRAGALRREVQSQNGRTRPQWHALSEFIDPQFREIAVSAYDDDLDAAAVLGLYGVGSEFSWDILRIEILYSFTCNEACPNELVVEKGSLLNVDGSTVVSGSAVYRHVNSYDYNPVSPVQ